MKRCRRPGRPAGFARSTVAGLAATLALLLFTACGAGYVEPRTSNAQLDFGIEMAKRGLWSEALFRFEQARGYEPQNARILSNMAVAYEALGQFEKALEHYQLALEASPGNSDLRRNYSRFVEFYRNFKADTEAEATAPEPVG